MFKFCNLYSGSSGNCSFIETDKTKILVDCGVSFKKIKEGLESINQDIHDIDAVLITHEHSDHIKGLGVLSKNIDVPIYANKKTLDEIEKKYFISSTKPFVTDELFEINDLKILPFSIPHDAADPVGFTINHKNKKISLATDIGHVENKLYKNLNESSFVLLESNYEPDMLKSSSYPYSLKHRILGPEGHLSNEDASNVIKTLVNNGLNNIMLGHLSKENNFPELAYQTTVNELIECNVDIDKLQLSVADREKINNIIDIK